MKLFDIHAHIGHSIYGYSQTVEELLRHMDQLNIEKAVLCPVQPFNYHLEPENERIAKAVQQYPERFVGFCRVDPRQGEKAEKEILRCIESLGMKGLFLHPWEETYPIHAPCVKALMCVVQKQSIPVMISGGHGRVSRAWQIADLARSFPEITFIATSGGQINISGMALREAEILLEENSNVLLETSGIYREDFIEDMAKKIGKDRLLFGSNTPEYDLKLEVLRPRQAHLSKEMKEAIGYGNALKVVKRYTPMLI